VLRPPPLMLATYPSIAFYQPPRLWYFAFSPGRVLRPVAGARAFSVRSSPIASPRHSEQERVVFYGVTICSHPHGANARGPGHSKFVFFVLGAVGPWPIFLLLFLKCPISKGTAGSFGPMLSRVVCSPRVVLQFICNWCEASHPFQGPLCVTRVFFSIVPFLPKDAPP